MIRGNKVILRAVEAEDLENLRAWRNLPEYRKHFREYREINSVMQKKWFDHLVCADDHTIMFSILDAKTKQLIGCCGLCYIQWIHRYADLSLYIGKNEAYIDDEGYAREACERLFQYAFNELNLHKIWTETYEFDTKKEALFCSMGFQQDGLLREHYFYDGMWWNSRILSLLRRDYIK